MNRPSLTSRLAQAANPSPATAPPQLDPDPGKAPPQNRSPKAAQRRMDTQSPAPSRTAAAARAGKTMIAGYFSAELARAVRVLAAERGVTIQALIGEGLDSVLRQAGKHPMGER